MNAFPKSSLLLATAAVLAVASSAVLAAPPADKGKRDRADFVRGNANTKAKPVVLPKTEREAIIERRVTAAGIVELQIPEDRMVNLVAIKRADGTVVTVHQGEGATHEHVESTGEVE